MPTDSLAHYRALVSTYSQFNNIIAIYQETVIPTKNIGFLDKNQTSVVLVPANRDDIGDIGIG